MPLQAIDSGPDLESLDDPFVYVAVATVGVSVVRIDDAPHTTGATAQLVRTVPLPSGHTANELQLAGRALRRHDRRARSRRSHEPRWSGPRRARRPGQRLALEGFVLYAATIAGIERVG